jgi:hypothetical protein
VTRWLRAAAYFAVCLVVAAGSGVLPDVLHGVGDADPLAVAGLLVLEVVAYGVIWPIGTYVLDRPRDWVSPAFGLVWGLCEGQLLLSGYVLVEQLGLGRAATVALAFLLLSAFQGVWHAAYWDVHVAPEHNVPEWNLRKVLLCHVPNLLATLTFYAVSGSAVWFVVLQTVSLVLSATAMRFPRPSRAEPAVSQA